MEWKIAVVDDLASDRERLVSQIRAQLAEEPLEISVYSDGGGLLADFQPQAFQLVFLDICMEGVDGVATAERLRKMDARLLIVFLTTSPEYVFDVQKFHPFDYLMKPGRQEEVAHVLQEARRVLERPDPSIVVRADRAEYRLLYSDIVAALSHGHKVEIRTLAGQVLQALATFSEIEMKLTEDPRFLLCNRGLLINMDHVVSLDGTMFRMADGSSCPLRVKKTREIIARFSQYQISQIRERMG